MYVKYSYTVIMITVPIMRWQILFSETNKKTFTNYSL